MTGIINFFRADPKDQIVGELFYLGGESRDTGDGILESHFLNCSDPAISPHSCNECSIGASYSDGSFVKHSGDEVFNISEVETQILKYYNEIAPENWDQAQYRPFRWITIPNLKSGAKYKNVKILLDNDEDAWYILAEWKKPMSSNYIEKLQKHFEDD